MDDRPQKFTPLENATDKVRGGKNGLQADRSFNAPKKSLTGFTSRWEVVSLAWQLGYIIALPLLAFIFAGKYLDERFGTHPYLKLVAIVLAITTTTFWLTKRFSDIIRAGRGTNNNSQK